MANLTSEEQSLNIRLGSDCKFPISGSFQPVSGLDLLLQDIQQLLLTLPGERVNRPNFGCTLRTQIWENLQDAAVNGASAIRHALVSFEPRIIVSDVTNEINDNTGLISFTIHFTVKNTDTKVNLIFPFRAGTALSFA